MNQTRILYAAFMNQSGYSQAAQNYILALDRTQRYDIKLRVFGEKLSKPAISDEKYELFVKMKKKQDTDDRILIYHCIPTLQRRVKKTAKTIGFATFETFQPPEAWIKILNQNDAIIAPSKFNYNIFAHMAIQKPIYYIPHAINTDIYNMDVSPIKRYDKYTFLFMGIWRERKGYKRLIEAWLEEFSDKDNVQLIIKTDRPKKAEQYVAKTISFISWPMNSRTIRYWQ